MFQRLYYYKMTDDPKRAAGEYPEADKVMRGGMLLGCHQGLSQEQLDHVCESVTAFMRTKM